MGKQPTCKERIGKELASEIETLSTLWDLYRQGNDETHPEYGRFEEHGLAFDYVAPGTFTGQKRGYFRYQISWGGPSDEFRFFCDERLAPVRIEYWFLDWFDGAKRTLTGKNLELLSEIFEFFKECGTVETEYEKAAS